MSIRNVTVHNSDGRPCGYTTPEEASRREQAGLGFVVRSRRGEAKRLMLYSCAGSSAYHDAREGIGALHQASRKTRPVRADGSLHRGKGQLLGNSRTLREFK